MSVDLRYVSAYNLAKDLSEKHHPIWLDAKHTLLRSGDKRMASPPGVELSKDRINDFPKAVIYLRMLSIHSKKKSPKTSHLYYLIMVLTSSMVCFNLK